MAGEGRPVRPLRIAMLGQKGFPAAWGGVEHHVEKLTCALAKRGHLVTVLARPYYQRETAFDRKLSCPGVSIRTLPSIETKHLDALTHTLLGTLKVAGPFDILHYHAIGPGSAALLARMKAPRRARVLTVHALDWKREKWAPWAGKLIRMAEAVAVRNAHRIICVSEGLYQYLKSTYGVRSVLIRNAAEAHKFRRPGPLLKEHGLTPGRYFFFAARLVPEKGTHLLIRAFRSLESSWKLAIAGPSLDERYASKLHKEASDDPRILFTGSLHGEPLEELYSNAGAFVLPSSLEGFSIGLLEAASYRLPIVASNLPAVREVLESIGYKNVLLWEGKDLEGLEALLKKAMKSGKAASTGNRVAGKRGCALPSWAGVAAATERCYLNALERAWTS